MKNKFVTAVTAASLLATIFGSSAFAAARPVAPTGTPVAKYTAVTKGAALTMSTAKAYGFLSDDSDAAASSATATLEFALFTGGSAGAGDPTKTLATADLKAVSSNSNIVVAWAYATANGASIGCNTADTAGPAGATLFATSDIVEGVAEHDGDGVYILCVAAKTATTAATGTITVSASKAGLAASSWVTMKTVTVTAVGPLKSLELSLTGSYEYVAGDNHQILKALTLVGKDAAGTVLNGATGSITAGASLPTVTEATDNVKNVNGDAIPFFDFGTETAVAVATPKLANEGSMRLFAIEANTCEAGNGDEILSDAGKSYSLAVKAGTIVSNNISITCTGDGSEAVLKSAAAEVTAFKGKTYASATGGSTFKIIGSIVDENGLPMGNGANREISFGDATSADDWTFTGLAALGIAAQDLTFAAGDVVNGKATMGTLAPTNMSYKTHKYSIKVSNSDLGATDAVAKTYSFTYAVSNATTITVKMNAAKTVATVTVNFGEDAADESAYLDVETATGKITTYRKIANASGVATWTIALRRQQVFMTATSDGAGVSASNLAVVTYK